MKRFAAVLIAAALFIGASAFAQIKSCEELKTEIDGKLKAKNVTEYTLEIVPAGEVKDQRVVGSCEGGKKKITYTKEKPKADK
jgi:hypothetical protein